MNDAVRGALLRVAEQRPTPCYVYFVDDIVQRVRDVRTAFGGRFTMSYAVKANPNMSLLQRLLPAVDGLDVSSIGEAELAIQAGAEPARLSFTGPAKRMEELERAVSMALGEIICESLEEMEQLDRIASSAPPASAGACPHQSFALPAQVRRLHVRPSQPVRGG